MLARVRDMGPNIATDHPRWTPTRAADPSEWPGDDVRPVFLDATEAARPGLVPATTGWFGPDRLIADLARRLATIETGAIDDAIVDSFRQIGQNLALDRIVLWRKSADNAFVVASHQWIKNPQPSGPESLKLASLPFVAAYAGQGRGLVVHTNRGGLRSDCSRSVPFARAAIGGRRCHCRHRAATKWTASSRSASRRRSTNGRRRQSICCASQRP